MDLPHYVGGMTPKHKRDLCTDVGITQSYLSQLVKGHRLPGPKLCVRLVDSSRGVLTLAELRPDIWGGKAA